MKKPLIILENINKSYGENLIVDNLSLTIYENEFLTLLGPSGCGKTTTLRMIAGFESCDSGNIIINDKIINNLPPYARPINTVFQKYALFPHLNVRDNITFGLVNRGKKFIIDFFTMDVIKKNYINYLKSNNLLENEEEILNNDLKFFQLRKAINITLDKEVDRVLKLVNMEKFKYRKIDQMSGGQQQRVAIARALINKPKILLLDEPLSALDLKLRQAMQYELKEMQRNLGITFVFVTHDQEEAMTMSDRICVMKDGIIQQLGTPKNIYNEPVNRFVATFIGETNILKARYKDGKVHFFNASLDAKNYHFEENEEVDLIIRPEDLNTCSLEKATLVGKAVSCIFKGVHYEICAYVENVEIVIHSYNECKVGEEIGIKIYPEEIHIVGVNKDE